MILISVISSSEKFIQGWQLSAFIVLLMSQLRLQLKPNETFSHLMLDLLNENNYYYYRLRE